MWNTRESSSRNSVFIGLGTNVDDRERNLNTAVEALRKIAEIKKASSIYETEPMEYQEQEWFLNMAVEIATRLKPCALLKQLQQIEQAMGRVREIRYGPRIIDLDILLYGDTVLQDRDLTIPHPKMRERAFVLVPLCEIAPRARHPLLHKTMRELLKNLKSPYKVTLWTPKK